MIDYYAKIQKLKISHQLITEENKTGMLVGMLIFSNETEKSLFLLVIRTVRDSVQGVLMLDFFALGILNGHPVDGNG